MNHVPFVSADGIGHIPIVGVNGQLRGTALVDSEDFERIARHRWSFHPKGGPFRTVWVNGRKTSLTMGRDVLGLGPGGRTPHIKHLNGPMDHRRRSLAPSARWLAKRMAGDPSFGRAVVAGMVTANERPRSVRAGAA